MFNKKETYQTINVFGVSNELVVSYVERSEVDAEFNRALTLKKHIIVFGSSKQGKTSLIKKHLQPNDYVRVECTPDQQKEDIYKSILRQLGVEIMETRSNTSDNTLNAEINTKLQLKLPVLCGDIETKTGTTLKEENGKTFRTVEYNIGIAQDISEILQQLNFARYILLENFHYLEEETQRKISFDLRTFQDVGINFIILGIWREKNRLAQYNGDLQDRMIEIPVEPWSTTALAEVIKKGSELLNVEMSGIENQIITSSFDSVGVLQELCKEACLIAGINETADKKIKIDQEEFDKAIQKKLTDYSGRHIRSLESLSIVSQTTTREGGVALFIPYYFVQILLTMDFDEIVNGIKRDTLHEKINTLHHRQGGVRAGDISNFLHTIIPHQIRKNVIPPLLDYDRSIKTLKVIDSTFYFFLRHADRTKILEDIDNPIEPYKDANGNFQEPKVTQDNLGV